MLVEAELSWISRTAGLREHRLQGRPEWIGAGVAIGLGQSLGRGGIAEGGRESLEWAKVLRTRRRVWRACSKAVAKRTQVLVLRLRHQLHQSRWTGSQYEALSDLLVEECRSAGAAGGTGQRLR
jgi:hypothetical protein